MDGLAQDCGNSSNNALELPKSFTKPPIIIASILLPKKQTRIQLVPQKQSTMSCEVNVLSCDVSSLIISLIKFKHPNQVDDLLQDCSISSAAAVKIQLS